VIKLNVLRRLLSSDAGFTFTQNPLVAHAGQWWIIDDGGWLVLVVLVERVMTIAKVLW
jgi:hypothetical protein